MVSVCVFRLVYLSLLGELVIKRVKVGNVRKTARVHVTIQTCSARTFFLNLHLFVNILQVQRFLQKKTPKHKRHI